MGQRIEQEARAGGRGGRQPGHGVGRHSREQGRCPVFPETEVPQRRPLLRVRRPMVTAAKDSELMPGRLLRRVEYIAYIPKAITTANR